ncbi:hypothetical protein COV18_02345 [Candidatus Woesearchaeota archaeon CG10_big_fil_rev_8_21_14_0_10_37_12]|nr:MAG: hypothetical protein COV18_02345 [Candidatus Woesearchaeota archaeon CG10_big_fil_rev_8_21_14_0_10_37_12]
MVFDSLHQEIKEVSRTEELSGKLGKQTEEDKLMNTVLPADKQKHEHAELLQEATNRSIGSFMPDLMFSQLTKNFSITQQLYGPKLIRMVSGYDPKYIEKNLKIPEFQKELRENIDRTIKQLKDEKLVDIEGNISQTGAELAALTFLKELDNYIPKESFGEKITKRVRHYGEKAELKTYKKGDRYKDIDIRKSIHKAIRRGHASLQQEDLIAAERRGKGKITLILALDASASMKGRKIEVCKKAGVTLAHKAITEKDPVGLVIFGSEIKLAVKPTIDFPTILYSLSKIRASRQTDFPLMIDKSIELFPTRNETKHLIILTDALPTVGKKPERETLRAVSKARGLGITTSLIGVNLDKEGRELAKQIATIGEGRFAQVRQLDELGQIVLEDYYSVR